VEARFRGSRNDYCNMDLHVELKQLKAPMGRSHGCCDTGYRKARHRGKVGSAIADPVTRYGDRNIYLRMVGLGDIDDLCVLVKCAMGKSYYDIRYQHVRIDHRKCVSFENRYFRLKVAL
jgi:hypothetical protein